MSAPSLAIAIEASTKPRWLRHITATESPSPHAELGERPGQRVGAAVQLAARQLAELVDRRRPVRVERAASVGEAAGRAGAPAAARPRPMAGAASAADRGG